MSRKPDLRIVTLLTDFGSGSSYVAQLKGALLSRYHQRTGNALLTVVDLSHQIAPQHVFAGALFLADVIPQFAVPAVHVAVIDPGVGTARRILLFQLANDDFLLAPDNGLASLVLEKLPARMIWSVENRQLFASTVTHTFHGRDIFAPVAAYLASGGDPNLVGASVDQFQKIQLPPALIEEQDDGSTKLMGEIIAIDSFGNALTNLTREKITSIDTREAAIVIVDQQILGPIHATYGEVEQGTALALYDSQDRLEIAIVCGSASLQLGLAPSMPIEVRIPPRD